MVLVGTFNVSIRIRKDRLSIRFSKFVNVYHEIKAFTQSVRWSNIRKKNLSRKDEKKTQQYGYGNNRNVGNFNSIQVNEKLILKISYAQFDTLFLFGFVYSFFYLICQTVWETFRCLITDGCCEEKVSWVIFFSTFFLFLFCRNLFFNCNIKWVFALFTLHKMVVNFSLLFYSQCWCWYFVFHINNPYLSTFDNVLYHWCLRFFFLSSPILLLLKLLPISLVRHYCLVNLHLLIRNISFMWIYNNFSI